MAKAVATEAGFTLFSISCANLVSKRLSGSVRLMKSLFTSAKAVKPAVIFIDEVDSLCSASSESENTEKVLVHIQALEHC